MSIVDIAMATYNGENYIKEQIESIIGQTFKDWRLIIRDDLSTDNTLKIIHEYAKKDSRIVLIEDDLGNVNVSKNFELALKKCDAPYIMFADQDDIWFENKIDMSIAQIKKIEKDDVPVLIFTNSILTNQSLDVKWENNYNFKEEPQLSNFLFTNAGYQGSAMMFNKSLKEKIFPFFMNSSVHDYHVSLVALLFGEVYHVSTPLMLYRRHSNSTTTKNITIKERLVWLFQNKSFLYDDKMISYLKKFISYYEKQITEKDMSIIKDYLTILDKQTSMYTKIKLIYRNKFKLRNSSTFLLFKIIILK